MLLCCLCSKLDDQGKAIIEMIAALRAQIGLKEIELRTLRMSATSQNPDYLRVEQQLTQMREKLRRMEKAGGASEGEILVPTGIIPEAGLEYLRSLREFKYSEAMFELLAKQYELARLDEAGNSSMVQVIDRAIPSERRSWPKRRLIVMIAMMLGLLLAGGHRVRFGAPEALPERQGCESALARADRTAADAEELIRKGRPLAFTAS